MDTLRDRTSVVQRIRELGLRPYVVHDATDVGNKETCPHIDTIVVDSLSVVRSRFLFLLLGWWLTSYLRVVAGRVFEGA